jgi:hypothetical protein
MASIDSYTRHKFGSVMYEYPWVSDSVGFEIQQIKLNRIKSKHIPIRRMTKVKRLKTRTLGILNLRKMVSDNRSNGIAVKQEIVTESPINDLVPPISSKNKNK